MHPTPLNYSSLCSCEISYKGLVIKGRDEYRVKRFSLKWNTPGFDAHLGPSGREMPPIACSPGFLGQKDFPEARRSPVGGLGTTASLEPDSWSHLFPSTVRPAPSPFALWVPRPRSKCTGADSLHSFLRPQPPLSLQCYLLRLRSGHARLGSEGTGQARVRGHRNPGGAATFLKAESAPVASETVQETHFLFFPVPA